MSLEQSEGSVLSEDALDTEDDALDTGDDLDVSVDELDTPDEADRHGHFTNRTKQCIIQNVEHNFKKCHNSLLTSSCGKQGSQKSQTWVQEQNQVEPRRTATTGCGGASRWESKSIALTCKALSHTKESFLTEVFKRK